MINKVVFSCLVVALTQMVAAITIVSPAKDATLSQLKTEQKAYLDMTRAQRAEVQTNAVYRNALAAVGSEPEAIMLAWTAEQAGPYTVKVMLNGAEILSLETEETSVEIDSLEIGTNFTWSVTSAAEGTASSTFSTADETPRLIGIASVHNARDLGGYIGLQGCRVRQGRIFRTRAYNGDSSIKTAGDGTSITNLGWQRIHEDDRLKLIDRFGVKNDIDLRYDNETISMTGSPLGSQVTWRHWPVNSYGSFGSAMSQESFAKIFRLCANTNEHTIVFHCSAGQDRTGAVAFELLALLGVDEESLYKDWEATMFWNNTLTFNVASRFEELIEVMKRRAGSTWAERAEAYAKECGITSAEIEDYREVMLPGYVRRAPDSRETATAWYVNGARTEASGDGTSVEKAFKTLTEAMTNSYLKSGHTVYVLPGTYSTDIMTVEQNKIVTSNRVVVPAGVKLVSTQGAAKTFLVGAASPTPVDDCYGDGPGAVRCVYLNANARLEGFTLTGGRVYCESTTKIGYGPSAGGGVSAQPTSVIADCVISNCVAVRGGAGDNGTYFRCHFFENRATHIGAHLNSDCNAFNCLFENALGGSYDAFIAPETKATTSNVFMNCTFDRALNQNIRASATGDNKRAHIVNCVLMSPPNQGGGKESTVPTAWYHNCFIGKRGSATDITIDADCTVTDLTDVDELRDYLGLGTDFQPTSLDSWVVDKGSNSYYAAFYPTNLDSKASLDLANASRIQRNVIDLGCYEGDASKTYVLVTVEPGMTVEGVTAGVRTPVLSGEELTYTLRRDFTGETLCSGFTVNGTFYDFEDYPNGWTHTVTGAGYQANETVAPVFVETTAWYVDPVKGNDANKGYHRDCAKQTLTGAMTDLPSGVTTVYAAAGWYTNRAMVVKASDMTSNRVIVAENVRLQGAGADKTFIVGAESPTPVTDCYGNGPYAIRCAMLRDGAVLAGFTLTNGHVNCTSTTAGDDVGGAISVTKYVYGTDCAATLEDCIIRNCVAVQSAATYGLCCRRCQFLDNRATRLYGVSSGGEFYNCFFDGNLSAGHTLLQPKLVNCTATANNTSNFVRYWGGKSDDDHPENVVNCVILGPTRDAADYTACVFDKDQKTKPSAANRGVGSSVESVADMKFSTDYQPLKGSCLINIGSNELYSVSRGGATDLGGKTRIYGGRIDVGAYEYVVDRRGFLLMFR